MDYYFVHELSLKFVDDNGKISYVFVLKNSLNFLEIPKFRKAENIIDTRLWKVVIFQSFLGEEVILKAIWKLPNWQKMKFHLFKGLLIIVFSLTGTVKPINPYVLREVFIQSGSAIAAADRGCWPRHIDRDLFVSKYEDDPQEAERTIAQDPRNTLCERAWWLFKGWYIKCTRRQYRGLDCGFGTHQLLVDTTRYRCIEQLVNDLCSKKNCRASFGNWK